MRPLVNRAFELWTEPEAESGQSLMSLYGEVALRPAEALAAVEALSIDPSAPAPQPVEKDQLAKALSGFRVPASLDATFKADAGMLRPEPLQSARD